MGAGDNRVVFKLTTWQYSVQLRPFKGLDVRVAVQHTLDIFIFLHAYRFKSFTDFNKSCYIY